MPEDETQEEGQEIVVQPLIFREVRPITNWTEWLERWRAADTLEEMLGLLHCGFAVPFNWYFGEKRYTMADRIAAYLMLADGWEEYDYLRMPDEREERYEFREKGRSPYCYRRSSEIRQLVARKAFNELCQNVFNEALVFDTRSEGYDRFWGEVIGSQQVLTALQNFFRVKVDGLRLIANLWREIDSHQGRLAISFLVNLSHVIWEWHELRIWEHDPRANELRESNRLMRARLDAVKPWMLEVLSALGKLDVLRERRMRVDKATLAKLREIAMRTKINNYSTTPATSRRVASLEEAYYAGSHAAAFLIRWQIEKKVEGRLAEIQKAEEGKRELERRIQELSHAK